MTLGWIRVDADVATHPKVALLASKLAITKREAVGLLVELWIWCGKFFPEGRIPETYVPALQDALGGDSALIEVLLETQLLDRDKQGFTVHDFLERNGLQLREAERKRKAREQARTGRAQDAHRAREKIACGAPTGRDVTERDKEKAGGNVLERLKAEEEAARANHDPTAGAHAVAELEKMLAWHGDGSE